MNITIMAAKSFARKSDGGRFHRFIGKLNDKQSAQITLEGETADALADIMVPAASAQGAYLSLVLGDGFKADTKPETFQNEAGVSQTVTFADLPVYPIRAVTDGALWNIGEAVVRPTPKAALTPDKLTDAVTAALNALRKA